MGEAKNKVISAGFAVFRLTRLHQLAAPWTRGAGAILMFHQVRPWQGRDFAPNRLLEITPDFLDAVLMRLRRLGFDIVSLEEALDRLRAAVETKPFIALTFDDGYKDTRDHALPVLESHAAPFTLYVTSGFAERTARLWWIELEAAIEALPHIAVEIAGTPVRLASATAAEKQAAFETLYRLLRAGPDEELFSVIDRLCREAGVSSRGLVEDLCLDWAGVREMARHALCTIGVHTVTHPRLAKHGAAFVRQELAESRAAIEAQIGTAAPDLAYPVGDPTSAGVREFEIARELGFRSAVTTRPGMLFRDHAGRTCALPRLSINGNWQSPDVVEILVSGAPFALWNRGRLVA